MSHPFIDSFAEKLYSSGLSDDSAPLIACSQEEFSVIEDKLSVRLPCIYQAFLVKMGRSTADFLRGEEHCYPQLLTLTSDAQELLNESDTNFRLPPTAFVFWMSQGAQFAFFDTAEGDDPPVYHYREDDLEPIKRHDRFSQWLDYQLAGQLLLLERVERL
jgi:hypothetical protein